MLGTKGNSSITLLSGTGFCDNRPILLASQFGSPGVPTIVEIGRAVPQASYLLPNLWLELGEKEQADGDGMQSLGDEVSGRAT